MDLLIYHKTFHSYRNNIYNEVSKKINCKIITYKLVEPKELNVLYQIIPRLTLIKRLIFFSTLLNDLKPRNILVSTEIGDINNSVLFFMAIFKKIKIITYGHGWNLNKKKFSPLIHLSDFIRYIFYKKSYSNIIYEVPQKQYLQQRIKKSRFFVLSNTIKIDNLEMLRKTKRPINLPEKYILFVGALNKSKRISSLVSNFNALKEYDNNLHMIVIGDGDEKYMLKNKPNITVYNRINNQDKLAPYFKYAIFTFIPGKVGLVLQNSIAFGTPLVTFNPNSVKKFHHAPEIYHLKNDITGFIIDENTSKLIEIYKYISRNRENLYRKSIEYFDINCHWSIMVKTIVNSLYYEAEN
jgi:glycosyltransferase involved in cell wall biosynthesis